MAPAELPPIASLEVPKRASASSTSQSAAASQSSGAARVLGREPVVDADDRDAQGVRELAVAFVALRRGTHVEAAAVDAQVDGPGQALGGKEDPDRDAYSGGFDRLFDGRRNGGTRSGLLRAGLLQLLERCGPAARHPRPVEGASLGDLLGRHVGQQCFQRESHALLPIRRPARPCLVLTARLPG